MNLGQIYREVGRADACCLPADTQPAHLSQTISSILNSRQRIPSKHSLLTCWNPALTGTSISFSVLPELCYRNNEQRTISCSLFGKVVLHLFLCLPFYNISHSPSHLAPRRSSCPVLLHFPCQIAHRFLRSRGLPLTGYPVLVRFCDFIVVQRICVRFCQCRLHLLPELLSH